MNWHLKEAAFKSVTQRWGVEPTPRAGMSTGKIHKLRYIQVAKSYFKLKILSKIHCKGLCGTGQDTWETAKSELLSDLSWILFYPAVSHP